MYWINLNIFILLKGWDNGKLLYYNHFYYFWISWSDICCHMFYENTQAYGVLVFTVHKNSLMSWAKDKIHNLTLEILISVIHEVTGKGSQFNIPFLHRNPINVFKILYFHRKYLLWKIKLLKDRKLIRIWKIFVFHAKIW